MEKKDKHSKKWNEFIHHLTVAWLLACILTVTKSYHWLDSLDVISMRMAVTWLNLSPTENLPEEAKQQKSSLVVTISDELFEQHFNQSSPLDRSKLSDLLDKLLAPIPEDMPKVLVIDLDLSPIKKRSDWTDAETRLYAKLKEFAYKRRIVLMTPLVVMSPEAIQAKQEWMQYLCEGNDIYGASGIHFAYPDLQTELSYVLRHWVGMPSLAETAALPFPAAKPDYANTVWVSRLPCKLIENGDTGFINRMAWQANPTPWKTEKVDLYPINWRIFGNIDVIRLIDSKMLDDLSLGKKLTDSRAVFIGGDYGLGDEYNTPLGRLQGIYIHAASFETQFHKVGKANKLLVFIVDIFLGILAGYAFKFTWAQYHLQRNKGEQLAAVFFGSLHLLVLIGGIVVLMLFSGWLLIEGKYWIQPAPVLLGMFIDSQISHFHGPSVHDSINTSNNDRKDHLNVQGLIHWPLSLSISGFTIWAWFLIAEEIWGKL